MSLAWSGLVSGFDEAFAIPCTMRPGGIHTHRAVQIRVVRTTEFGQVFGVERIRCVSERPFWVLLVGAAPRNLV